MALWGAILAVLGSVLALASLFLPWVESQTARDLGPIADLGLGLLAPQLAGIVDLVRASSGLTGIDMAFRYDLIAAAVKALVAAPAVLAIATLVVLLVAALTRSKLRGALIALIVLCVLAVAALLLGSSSITHLGMGNSVLTNTAASLLGLTRGTGYWLAVAGLVLIAVGLGVSLADSPPSSYQEDDWIYSGSNMDW